MKKASSLERNRNFHICAHMFKAMMGTRVLAEIEREHLVKQTLEIIKKANPKDIRKRLQVSFKGEPGLVLMLVVSPRRSVHKALP